MGVPLDIRDMLSSGAKLRAERERPVRIAVFVDATAPDDLIDALRGALHPQTGHALLHVEAVVPGDVLGVDPSADAVIGIAGGGTSLVPSLRKSRDQAIPTVVVAVEPDRDALARRLEHPLLDAIAAADADAALDALGVWLGERVPAKRIAMAANFAFVRRAVAEESVKATAFQNAVIGGVAFIPGADMPLMTANQAKMVMQIAAAYGQELGAERVKELATVVGGAFVLRTAARQFVGLIPGFGWAIKAGIGYSGTLAMGYAAIEYFESGADLSGLAERLRTARDRAIDAARRRRGRIIDAKAVVLGEEDLSTPAVPEAALPSADASYQLSAGENAPQ